MTRPLPPPAVYVPDATSVPALWPWVRPAAPAPIAAPIDAVATPARPGPPASPQTLAWVARYQRGDSVADIARTEGVHRTSVHGALLRAAVRLEGGSERPAVLLGRLRAQAGAR